MGHDLPTRILGGVRVALVTRADYARLMLEDWRRLRATDTPPPPRLCFTANGQVLARNATDPEFARMLRAGDSIVADGQSLVLFSRLWPGRSLPGRVCTTDFFHDAAAIAEANGMSFFLLGASEEDNAAAVDAIRRRYPRLRIAGRRNGFFGEAEFEVVVAEIAAAKPDVVWVGMGIPRQHSFCLAARDRLSGVTWLKTCGGLFDYLSGRMPRAPRWMQVSALEWLFRLLQEPDRLFRRYLITNVHAAFLLLTRSDCR